MASSSMPAYYMIMIGGSLTIVTAIVILIGGGINTYYSRFFPIFSELNQVTAFILALVPGLGVIYLGQRFIRKPDTQLIVGLAVAALSVISLFGIVGSGVYFYIGVFFSGPPISFAGGIIGAFLNRAVDSSRAPTNPSG